MFPFHLLFGASSSQAVHPDRSDPKERIRRVATDLLPVTRDLVLIAREQGAQIQGTRPHFGDAKAALDGSRYQDAVRLSARAVRAAAETMGPAGANLIEAFDLCLAMEVAKVSGADVREASHLFNGANADLQSPESPFAGAWKALVTSVGEAGPECASHYRESAVALGGSARVLSVAGGN